MKKYRLKSEAVKFFKKDLACRIYELATWTESYNVDENALEEVEDCFISYGREDKIGSSLCGWGNPDNEKRKTHIGAHFCFTIHFPSMKYKEYDEFQKGKITRKFMDMIQKEVNRFYNEFNNELC